MKILWVFWKAVCSGREGPQPIVGDFDLMIEWNPMPEKETELTGLQLPFSVNNCQGADQHVHDAHTWHR